MDLAAVIEGIEIIDVIITALCGSAAISETLPHIKKIKANSVFQLGFNFLKTLLGALRSKQ
jgi:hypothetical protein